MPLARPQSGRLSLSYTIFRYGMALRKFVESPGNERKLDSTNLAEVMELIRDLVAE